MKKVLAAALSIIFILALTVPGFADGDTVVTMEVENVASPEDCEWTLTIPADFSISFAALYNQYFYYMKNHPEGVTFISEGPTSADMGDFALNISGLPKGYTITVNTTHTLMASPDTDTSIDYGLSYSITDFPNGNVPTSHRNEDNISFYAGNANTLEGMSGAMNGHINALSFRDIEAVGNLKSGSYSTTITFTSALEEMS